MKNIKYIIACLILLNSSLNFCMEDKTKDELGLELIKAINNKDLDQIKKLIKLGANLNIKDENGYTPLFLTSFGYIASKDIATILLQANANPNILCNDESVLSHCCKVYAEGGQYGHNDFYGQMAELLIKYGANIYQKDKYGNIPLERVINRKNRPDLIKLLNEAKEKADLMNELIAAIKDNKINIVKKILSSNVNLTDYNNNNALHIAAQFNTPKMFYYIWILAPKLFNVKNREGKLAIDLNPEIILHLINLGLIKKHNEEEQVKKKLKLN